MLPKLHQGNILFNERFTIYSNVYNNSKIDIELTSLDFPISLIDAKIFEFPPTN
jgi:hypothetical protein